MDSADLLRKALQAARQGHELTARDLFQDVVRLDPTNEVAWVWLAGLLDPLADRIAACERVLSLNPGNQQIRAYYDKLLVERQGEQQEQINALEEKMKEIRWFIAEGKNNEAMFLLQKFLSEESGHKEAWQLFASLSNSIQDKVRAYETILKIDPDDSAAHKALKRYQYFEQNPLELAVQYEEEGALDKALALYQTLATEAGDSSAFENVYKNIVRIENAKVENVRRVKPALTVLRLSAGLPLLYIFEIFIQEGFNPIRHPAPILWFGLPLVMIGSYLLAVASVRVQHAIWRKWFGDPIGKGSDMMRALVTAAGLVLILAPHVFLAIDSYLRLQIFQVPAIPWIK